ncbi:host cell division inhibitor Icd-like protein [Pantoea sp.]|uniref:host cell division inhibitor Icd-like protein n=1 Tax=Pantoea sp. TaxID=69393 RepID=UPI0028B0A703|nr:host cell division inhibitor Icd-like protein [Pantoea sp.]
MARQKSTWIFAAINRSQLSCRPVMLRITDIDERSARSRMAADYILLFAGRLPVHGGRHA